MGVSCERGTPVPLPHYVQVHQLGAPELFHTPKATELPQSQDTHVRVPGYLAHTKQHPPQDQLRFLGIGVRSQEEAVSYERGASEVGQSE